MPDYPQRTIRFSYTENIDITYDSRIDLDQYVKRDDYASDADYYEAVIDFLIQGEDSVQLDNMVTYEAYYSQEENSFKFLGEVNQWNG